MIIELLRSYNKVVHLPFRELQDNGCGSGYEHIHFSACEKPHQSHWTTCVRVAVKRCLTPNSENGAVHLFMSPVSTSIDRSCFLINNAFMGAEGTECSPVLPYQCREQLIIYFSSPAEIGSSMKDTMCTTKWLK